MTARRISFSNYGNVSAVHYIRAATLLLLFLLLTISFVIGVMRVTDGYWSEVGEARDTAQSTTTRIKGHAVHMVSATIMVTAGIADVYQDQLNSKAVNVAYLERIMADKLINMLHVRAFLLVGPDGKLIAAADRSPANNKFYAAAIAATPQPPDSTNPRFVGKLFNDVDGSEPQLWFLPVGIGIGNGSMSSTGSVIAVVDGRIFSDFYRSISIGPHGHLALWTSDGHLVAGSPNMRTPVGAVNPDVARRYAAEIDSPRDDQIHAVGPTDAAPHLITAAAHVKDLPLMVTTGLDDADFLSEWRKTRLRMILSAVGIVFAAVVFAGIIHIQLLRAHANEEALHAAKAVAEEANEAKSRFLAHMSHEFRTPLNAIMGFADIIQTKAMGDPLAPVYATYANHIYRSGEHLLEIVNDILDMAKIESGVQSMQREAMDIASIVEGAVAFLEGMTGTTRLTIKTEITPHLPAVMGDERFVRQVLINLLSNAIKFSPDAGVVVVRAILTPDEDLDLSVIDHGTGIEPLILKRIGEPFLQGNPTLSRNGQGTGLGLSICKHYMDLMGGALLITSRLGVGTTVTMRFPRSPQSGAPAKA